MCCKAMILVWLDENDEGMCERGSERVSDRGKGGKVRSGHRKLRVKPAGDKTPANSFPGPLTLQVA